MLTDIRPLAVIEPGPPELALVQSESKRSNQVQSCAGISAQPHDVAGVRRDLGLVKNNVEHGASVTVRQALRPVVR